MCIVVLALGLDPRLPFVLGANRDEYHRRPSASAHRWHDHPDVWGGRDLEMGGTWLAASARGALAVVTNVRNPASRRSGGRSRGLLVRDFVAAPAANAAGYLADQLSGGERYDGFNLLLADAGGVWYGSNRGAGRRLGPGIYGLSNDQLDTPWPKVVRVRDGLRRLLAGDARALESGLLGVLSDRRPVPDAELPATGVPLEWERRLAPPFIVSPDYGTRCSTVVTVDAAGCMRLTERSFDPGGHLTGTTSLVIPLVAGLAA